MSVHSQSTAPYEAATTPEFPRHVVTAVLVSHDGARWLPDVLAGLLGQERPVQNAYAADTGSADDSARLITEALGDERVLHLARRTGFGAAVEEAARTAPVLGPEELAYLKRPSGWDPVSRTWRDDSYDLPELPHGEPVQWLWLLHDDCAPEPDALAELLRVADSNPRAAIVGPKLRGWYDRKQLLEVGVSIAHSGRRWTGLDRREQDQGQHDQVRPVLSVSSAGMLIRRDVWQELGGFDRRLPLMRDDVDLCWRAHAAGHTVLVAPDAAVRHAEAAARERRTVDCAGRSVVNPHRVDKAGAVYTMLVNSRPALLPYVFLRIVVGTVLRTVAYLVGKVPGQAVDEVMGLFGTLLRPGRILAGRKRRGKSGVEAGELRPLFPPPGATIRATVESVAGSLGAGTEDTGGSRHGAVESGPGGDDADFLEIEQFARLKKIARKPAPVLFALLLVVSLVACRNLLGGGTLMGGALLPAPDHIGSLWSRYADAWHPIGAGGTQTAPPYLAILAVLSALCFGSTGLALTLLLVCSVPLAGLTAYFASRPLVASRQLRAWAAIAYAFLPAATGALAAGRLGTAVLAILLPPLARAGVSAAGFRGDGARGSWRATWTYALLLTVATAFTPVVWPLAVLLGLGVLALRRGDITAYGLRLLAAVGTPVLMLAPWSLTLLTGPSGFLKEAGLEYGDGSAGALDLLGASPGGPKTVGGLLLIGIVGAALAALLREERAFAIRTSWVVALTGFLFAALSNRSAWAGPATLVYGLALLAAAVLGAEYGRTRVAGHGFGWRQPVAALIALAAALGPVYSAAHWMIGGADGPLKRRDPVQVPAFVAEESGTRDQARTLVLGGTSPAKVAYTLVRGSGAQLGDAELAASGSGAARLGKVVSNLVAGSGADQSSQLSGFAVRYVLVRDGAPRAFARTLDSTPGLTRLSQLDGSALWRVDRQVARAVIVPAKGGESLPVAADPVDIHTAVPAGEAGRVLRIADTAAPGWSATLDGKALKKTTVDEWAQGFELPAGAGRLDVTYDAPFTHTVWIWTQAALALVLLVLALPGRRREIDDDLPEQEPTPAAAVPAQAVTGEGRRARRLRAQADAEAAPESGDPSSEQPARPAEVPQQPAYGEWDTAQYATTSPADTAEHDQQAQQGYDPYQQHYPGYQPYPEGQYPEGPYSDGQYTQASYPEQHYPDGSYPQVPGEEGQLGESQYGDGQYGDGQGGDGRYGDGQGGRPQGYDPYQQPGAQQPPPEGPYDPYGYGYPPEQPEQQPHRPDGSQQ
ncbi:N-acetylglucosaminyl-diphospho-decaprenol L-rhamnosyltransferase [Streptomyces hundungensis]|uniref:N-acetylglucosaminyl-diphospho-decaprenol L-rhamnosyltransferase n=1 Tax=Streptomyces hundungensis TaxID=1077946 RepID=A0A387HGB5_9ACTN|nr:glycosyltransferase family 2 protein [Streptomyces hundungensis]AYG82474.1 N-acetylglucosaminyl-diphospho-decaprenol L-rhamnosyltransferase [Streptomyces hundungensis]